MLALGEVPILIRTRNYGIVGSFRVTLSSVMLFRSRTPLFLPVRGNFLNLDVLVADQPNNISPDTVLQSSQTLIVKTFSATQ